MRKIDSEARPGRPDKGTVGGHAGGKAQPEAKHQGTFRSKAGSLGAMDVQGQGKVKPSAIWTANLFLPKDF